MSLRSLTFSSNFSPSSLTTFLASEKPFECRPLLGSATKTSPDFTNLLLSISSASAIPTANPARSKSPFSYIDGISAVSPPISAHCAFLQPFAILFTTSLALSISSFAVA